MNPPARSAPCSPARALVLLPLLVFLGVAALLSSEPEPTAAAREVLEKMEQAYKAEDTAGAMALVAPDIPGYEQFGNRLDRLFAGSNFFDVRYDHLVLLETSDGALAGNALFTLKHRKVGKKTPEALRTLVALRFEREGDGDWKIVQHHNLPDPDIPPDGPVRATRYDLSVRLDPRAGVAEVEGEIELRNVSVGDVDSYQFLLDGFAEDLEFQGPGGDAAEVRLQRGGLQAVEVLLPRPLPSGGSTSLSFRYRLDHPHATANLSIGPGEVTFLGGTAWVPIFYIPAEVQEQMFHYDLRVEVPDGWAAVSGGDLAAVRESEGGRVYHWFTPSLAGEVALVAGRFEKTLLTDIAPKADSGPVEIIYWRPEGRQAGVPETVLLENVAQTYRILAGMLGPPPHPRVHVVTSGRFGMYGGTGLWVLDRNWLRSLYSYSLGLADRFAHQAAHAWFVQGVETAGPGTAFVREGPSELMAVLVLRELFGERGFEKMLRIHLENYLYSYYTGRPIGLSEGLTPASMETGRTQGSLLLNDLRRIMGDGPLLAALRTWMKDNSGRIAGVWDLQAAFAKAAREEGADEAAVQQFFSEFVFAGAHPDPRIESVVSVQEGDVWKTAIAVRNAGQGRTLVEVEAQTRSGSERGTLDLASGETATLTLETADRVDRALLDPGGTLFQLERGNDWWPSPPGGPHPSRNFGEVKVGREKLEEVIRHLKERE